MRIARRVGAFGFLVAACCGVVGAVALGTGRVAARADGPAADEAAFLAALEQAKGVLQAGRGGDGLRIVEKALGEHKGKDYVRAKRVALEDLVRRLSFRKECAPPEPQSVVQGKLKKFVSRNGDLEIRYEAGKPDDFEREEGDLWFPARFRGPYSISIRGDSYPETTDTAPCVQVGLEKNPKTGKRQAWVIAFGIPPYTEGSSQVWLPARIRYVDGDDRKLLAEKETSPAMPRKPYRCDVSVTAGRISASVNGTSIGSAAKPAGVFGYALLQVRGWKEIVISGQVEPSWIQAKIDAIVDEKRRAFDEKFDVRDVLPAWLYEAPSEPPSDRPTDEPPDDGDPDAPAALRGLPPELAVEYLQAMALLLREAYDAALVAAESLREKGAPDSVTCLLAAQALLGLDQATKALAEVDRAIAADPDMIEAYLLKANLLLRVGREDELVGTLRAAAARPSAGAQVFEAAGITLLLAGRIDEARTITEDAARRGKRSPGLDALGRVTVRAQNGPDWPRSFQYKSTNYHVVSDIDSETARQAALLLEEGLTEYRVNVHALKPEQKRLYKVYLFSGEAGFQRYVADSSLLEKKGAENAAGLYSGILKQLLIWNLPNRDEMMRTVRHEGFHQYLDRLLPDPPVWFNEGLATYYEAMQRVGGDLKIDRPRPDVLGDLKDKPLVPLAAFLHISPRKFYATAPHSYAQAWLIVHMLRHGTPKHRDRYRTFLARLEKSSGAEAMQEVFDEASLPALDADLRAHYETLTKGK